MIDVSIHNPRAESALHNKILDCLFFRVLDSEAGGRVTLFFNGKQQLRDFIISLTEAEMEFGNSDEETIHFNK